MFQNNVPDVHLGIVAVSRDCFPMELSENRRKAVVATYKERGKEIHECPVVSKMKPTRKPRSRSGSQTDVNAMWFTSGTSVRKPRKRFCPEIRRPGHVRRGGRRNPRKPDLIGAVTPTAVCSMQATI